MSITQKELIELKIYEDLEKLSYDYVFDNDFVYCRKTPIKEYIISKLTNKTSIEILTKLLGTKLSYLDKYIEKVSDLVVDFCSEHNLYKKKIPKKLLNDLVNHYFNLISTKRLYIHSYNRQKQRKLYRYRQNNHSLNKENQKPHKPMENLK